MYQILMSLEQFIRTAKDQEIFWNKILFQVVSGGTDQICSNNNLNKQVTKKYLYFYSIAMMGVVKTIIIKDNFSRQEKKQVLVTLTGFTQHSSWIDQESLGRNTLFRLLQFRLDLITLKVLPYSEIDLIGPNP